MIIYLMQVLEGKNNLFMKVWKNNNNVGWFVKNYLMCLVGLGVWLKASLRISSCLALMVVRGPRRFVPPDPSSCIQNSIRLESLPQMRIIDDAVLVTDRSG